MLISIDVRKVNDFGIGTYLRNLLKYLPTVDSENEYVLLAFERDRHLISALGDYRVVAVSSDNYSLREHAELNYKLRRIKADLFHAPHYVFPIGCPCPVVVTVHDAIHLLFPQYLPSQTAVHYAKYMIRRALVKSRLVMTVSDASKKDLLDFADIPESKIRVIPNGLDPEVTGNLDEEALEQLKRRFQLGGRVVLFVGNIKPHKNVERLIDAFARVRESTGRDDLTLVVVGDEVSKYQGLRRAIHRHDVRNHVRFFGFVPEKTLLGLYKIADVFVFPSLYEGFGLPPLEAMANGTPVVTSNVSSLPEVVGDAALTVDPYDVAAIAAATHRILTEPELHAELRAKGLARAKLFSWERAVKDIHRVYEDAMVDRSRQSDP